MLLDKGINVTVATRGKTPIPFDERVNRLVIDRYIFTSSLSVYAYDKEAQPEGRVNPYIYPIRIGSRFDFSYDEGKRQVEADSKAVTVEFKVTSLSKKF